PEPSRRTSPSYRLSRSVAAMDAVASAVGSIDVGSWMMPMIALGLLEAAAGAAAADVGTAAAVGWAAAAGVPPGATVAGTGVGAGLGLRRPARVAVEGLLL